MMQNNPKVLETAYSAVKMQRMNADIGNLWGKDPEIRKNFIEIEQILQKALINAKQDSDAFQRGGKK
jgi:hypothetical protein